jgi:hypothetical protein
MNELVSHLQEQRFSELKTRLKKCQTQAEQRAILEELDSKRLDQFTAWLLIDGNATAALHMAAVGLALRRQSPA